MGFPTLLQAGQLKAHPEEVPVDYIVRWLKRRMAEFGGAPPESLADRVLIVRSETGSGKSTALPVHVFRLLRGEKTEKRVRLAGPGVICTQPRILTAQTLARDVAKSEHYPDMVLGATVGYQTGPINEKPESGLIYATAPTLLAQLRVFPDSEIMARYRFIIVDEAHERSLATDSLLLRLKAFLCRNLGDPRLPFLILASATLPVRKYARFFAVEAANVVEVAGRQHHIDDFYPERGTNNYPAEAARVALEIHRGHPGDPPAQADVLIFMPGAREIEAVVAALTKANWEFRRPGSPTPPFLILALSRAEVLAQGHDYRLLKADPAALRVASADGKAFVRPSRRIIVSTVVAETGLTIETLKYVVDCGWSRTEEVYYPGAFRGIVTRPAPQSRIEQRRGRAGREFPGEFYPLYTENVYEALDKEQLPEIIAEGVAPIFLDVVQVTAGGGVFRVEEIDMLDPPPSDALAAALEEAIAGGFLRAAPADAEKAGHELTRLGGIAARFNFLGMAQVRTLLAGYLWKVSLQDLAFVVALYEQRDVPIYAEPKPGATEPREAGALRAGLPAYLSQTTGGGEDRPPSEAEAYYYRARLLISDDFLEALLAFEGFVRALDGSGGDLARLLDWCDANGVSFEGARLLAGMRDEVVNEALSAGLNPFWGDEYRLAAAPPEAFFDTVVRLKHCICAGLGAYRLTYDPKRDAYRARTGHAVEVPPAYTDTALSRLRGLGLDAEGDALKPRQLVTNQVRIRGAKGDRRDAHPPLLFRLHAGLVSVLDGYVDVDDELWAPRP